MAVRAGMHQQTCRVVGGGTNMDVEDGKQWTRNGAAMGLRWQLPWRWFLRGLEVLMCWRGNGTAQLQ